eukprot:3212488-Prymnesium_polylepis.1
MMRPGAVSDATRALRCLWYCNTQNANEALRPSNRAGSPSQMQSEKWRRNVHALAHLTVARMLRVGGARHTHRSRKLPGPFRDPA